MITSEAGVINECNNALVNPNTLAFNHNNGAQIRCDSKPGLTQKRGMTQVSVCGQELVDNM